MIGVRNQVKRDRTEPGRFKDKAGETLSQLATMPSLVLRLVEIEYLILYVYHLALGFQRNAN